MNTQNVARLDEQSERETPIVLLIDDMEDIFAVWSLVLEAEGITVFTSQDGVDGLEKARVYRPDVIVCDLMMPGLDGLEVCATIRRDATLSHVFIILWTAAHGVRAGNHADLVVEKPVEVEPFLKLIRDVVRH
ncbi:response regulator [Caballeronia sp. HLA56]